MSKTQTRSALHFLGGSKTQTSCLPNPNITFAKPKRYVAAYKYICIYVPPPVRDIILRIRPRRDSCNAKFDDGLVPRPQTHSAVVRCAEHVVGMTATPIFNRSSSNLLFARRRRHEHDERAHSSLRRTPAVLSEPKRPSRVGGQSFTVASHIRSHLFTS